MPAPKAGPPDPPLDAAGLRELLRAATLRLEQRASAIDRLNVFPVPDADTGSNMVYGMRLGLREAEREPVGEAGEAGAMAAAFARGALAGARGNSGLILSQLWRGLAEAVRGARTLGTPELARGLAAGSRLAFRAVARPVPGTILTVMQDVARAAQEPPGAADGSLAGFLGRLVEAARASVARTPRLLAVLARAGVVDAGAEGLHRILEGAWGYARQRAGQPPSREEPEEPVPAAPAPAAGAGAFGFCAEFFLHPRQSAELDPDEVRAALRDLGDSLIVTPDTGAVRVHLHTSAPRAVLERASLLGRPEQVSLRDMDAQHRQAAHRDSPAAEGQAVVALVPGRGLAEVFRSLGAAEAAVRGDPQEQARLAGALRLLPAEDILLLPNLPEAELEGSGLPAGAAGRLHVLPARTVPQGVAAMVAFDPASGLAENLRRMGEAIAAVGSLELREEGGRVVGLVEGRRAAEGRGLAEVLERLLPLALGGRALERLSLFYAAGVAEPEARGIGEGLRRKHPGLQVEVLAGGQPGRGLIAAAE